MAADGLTSKEAAHAAEPRREDVNRARQAWFDGQLDLDLEKLIVIDETGASAVPQQSVMDGPCDVW